jgi:hypothetical protein
MLLRHKYNLRRIPAVAPYRDTDMESYPVFLAYVLDSFVKLINGRRFPGLAIGR